MNDDDLTKLKARVRALEVATVTDLFIRAFDRGETDTQKVAARRGEVWQALGEAAASGDNSDPELSAALHNLAGLAATLGEIMKDGPAEGQP
ncbi:hypothetical protein ACLBWH_12255 [Sphingomonas sp. M6A6_1c]